MATNPVLAKIQGGAAIIDVRSPDEFADGAYPGAKNIPVNALVGRLNDVGPKDKPVVVYCASGGRSAVAAQILRANGFVDVLNAGGLEDMPRA